MRNNLFHNLKHRKRRWLLAAAAVLITAGGLMTALLLPDWRPPLPHTPHEPIRPVTSGSFTQPWALESFTAEQWAAEFDAMQSAGIDLWIFQWTGDSGRKTTIYPTHLPGWQHSMTYDPVEAALQAAEARQMQVYLGLAFNEAWWQKEGSDRAWLEAEAAAMNAVGGELYAQYYARYPETFAGWYINWEMDNANGYNFQAGDRENITWALAEVSGHLKSLNPALPVAIAPFFNAKVGAGPRRWQYFWYDLLRETQVDILMLQDGVGVGHAEVEQIAEWFEAVCDAAHLAGKQCWSDLENFITTSGKDSGPFAPAPPERVAAQHQAAAPYVDRIITFSFLHYMSPAAGVDGQYLAGYLAYLDSLP